MPTPSDFDSSISPLIRDLMARDPDVFGRHHEELSALLRTMSGTYVSAKIAGYSIDLRVDIDGLRPLNMLSGDVFQLLLTRNPKFSRRRYKFSFVAQTVKIENRRKSMVVSAEIRRYDGQVFADRIEVEIPRVAFLLAAPDVTVRLYKGANEIGTAPFKKTSEFFRAARLEIDRFTDTNFPPTANTCEDPHPSDLACESIDVRTILRRSGVDLTVQQDDVLSDADSADAGTNWNMIELHDLMEARFDDYQDSPQWIVYSVVVPRFGDPDYNSGFYGVMFDWGGYQSGDTRLRQGFSIAEDAIEGRSGNLYDTAAKRNRLILQTFVHELGHAFNLPHSWQRATSPNSASPSFMNYPWLYPGGESAFWSDFRWQFDDVELAWIRHGDRADVIFGGRDWIGNNLSTAMFPADDSRPGPLALSLVAPDIIELGEPLHVELQLTNRGKQASELVLSLAPEDGQVVFYIERPDRAIVKYVPPARRCSDLPARKLGPGASEHSSVLLSYASWGHVFSQPGEYRIRACVDASDHAVADSNIVRLRVAAPVGREAERLTHLLLAPETARFIYLGGSTRFPKLISDLEEAVRRHAITSPEIVRRLHVALGTYYSRALKVVPSGPERKVAVRAADLAAAAEHLELARKGLNEEKTSGLDDLTYIDVSRRLIDVYLRSGRDADAARTLADTTHLARERAMPMSKLGALESCAAELKRRVAPR